MMKMGARGADGNRFRNGLGIREIGGSTTLLYLQYVLYDIS